MTNFQPRTERHDVNAYSCHHHMLLFTTICRPKILTTTILQHSALSRSNARVSRPQQRKLILYTILRDLTMTFDQVLIEGLAVPVGGGGGGGRLSLFLFPIRKLFVGSPLWRGESWRSLVLIKESHFSWLWLIIFPFSQSYKWLETGRCMTVRLW